MQPVVVVVVVVVVAAAVGVAVTPMRLRRKREVGRWNRIAAGVWQEGSNSRWRYRQRQ